MMVDIAKTFGALLLGGLFASLLSGFVVVQVVVYFKLYLDDGPLLKSLVLVVWLLDTSHTTCIWLSLWDYLIVDYGNIDAIDNIVRSLAMSVLITALLTVFVHMFFARRIFLLSKRNYFLTMPIVILAILRLVSASSTTAYMLKLGTFATFKHDVRWVFTTGLALSTIVDILITSSLCFLLQTSRTGIDKSNAVIDSLIMYSFETGALTCAGTIASMLCWITLPNNLIFMGLHFVIGKLYANSLLVTLNSREFTRNKIRRGRSNGSGDHGAVHVIDPRRQKLRDSDEIVLSSHGHSETKTQTLEVTVEQSVHLA